MHGVLVACCTTISRIPNCSKIPTGHRAVSKARRADQAGRRHVLTSAWLPIDQERIDSIRRMEQATRRGGFRALNTPLHAAALVRNVPGGRLLLDCTKIDNVLCIMHT